MIGKREIKSNMELFQYRAEVIRVVDGDTLDVKVV
jgi:endonuclease YncB( thermonuclease family)